MNHKRLKSLVEGIAKDLADHPDRIFVEADQPRENMIEIIVHADPGDLRMIIGRGGKNVQALRTLVYGMCAKTRTRCYITVEENQGKMG